MKKIEKYLLEIELRRLSWFSSTSSVFKVNDVIDVCVNKGNKAVFSSEIKTLDSLSDKNFFDFSHEILKCDFKIRHEILQQNNGMIVHTYSLILFLTSFIHFTSGF